MGNRILSYCRVKYAEPRPRVRQDDLLPAPPSTQPTPPTQLRYSDNGCLVVFDPSDPTYNPIGLRPVPPAAQSFNTTHIDSAVNGKRISEHTYAELILLQTQLLNGLSPNANSDLILEVAGAIHAIVQD
jgi:hypothetical protein